MKVGFIGMGNMASAICSGCIESTFLKVEDCYAYDIANFKIDEKHNIHHASSEVDLVQAVDIVVLAIKPNVIESVLEKIKEELENKIIISIVAGYDFHKIEAIIPKTKHLSVMPNTPAMVNKGMTLLEATHSLETEEFKYVQDLFTSIGEVVVLPTYQMSAAGAVSGCGPAYYYMMLEAMADGAVLQGVPREVAYKLAAQTMIGAGTMQLETKLHPGILKDNVCSPGGITIKGVKALEENGFRYAIIKAIEKSS